LYAQLDQGSLDPAPDDPRIDFRVVQQVARSLVPDRLAAEDLAQDAWVATRGQPQEELKNPKAWFSRVIRRLWINRRRSEAARRQREEASARPEVITDEPPDCEQEELRRLVHEELAMLRPLYRDALIDRFVEERSVIEISARSGVPAETVRTRIKRAQGQLRARIERRQGIIRPRTAATRLGRS